MFIEINNIYFKYQGSNKYILNDFSFSINKGEVVCILGESGSGKSTILRLLSGLEIPDKGEIIINNKVMVNENIFMPPEKRQVGMVFQDYALFPHLTVTDNVKFGLFKMNKRDQKRRLFKLFRLVGIEDITGRYPHQLSGGQQQRVALARALAPGPKVLLLDEPFSNLDANLKKRIRSQLKEVIDSVGITTIIVSHDKNDALEIADKLIIIKNGEIIQSGTPSEVVNFPISDYVARIIK